MQKTVFFLLVDEKRAGAEMRSLQLAAALVRYSGSGVEGPRDDELFEGDADNMTGIVVYFRPDARVSTRPAPAATQPAANLSAFSV